MQRVGFRDSEDDDHAAPADSLEQPKKQEVLSWAFVWSSRPLQMSIWWWISPWTPTNILSSMFYSLAWNFFSFIRNIFASGTDLFIFLADWEFFFHKTQEEKRLENKTLLKRRTFFRRSVSLSQAFNSLNLARRQSFLDFIPRKFSWFTTICPFIQDIRQAQSAKLTRLYTRNMFWWSWFQRQKPVTLTFLDWEIYRDKEWHWDQKCFFWEA